MSAEIIEMNAAGPDREAFRQWERDEVARAIQENKILKLSDRKRVALRLARMLTEAGTHERGLKTRIVRLVWPNDDAPLKKLDLVTLPLDGEPNDQRLDRLAKKPKHYAELAKAIAHVSGRRRYDVCVELFRGTQIEAAAAARARKFSDDLPEDWDKLAELIEAMAAALVKRTRLREHLVRIADRSGTYSLETQTIRRSGSTLLPHGPLANGYEVWEEFPPIPSVPLFVKLLTSPFERTVKLIDADGVIRAIPVTVTVGREVRLAIGPADERETPGPMFEIRTVVDMIDRDGRNWASRRSWFYLEGTEQFTTEDEHGNEVVAEIELGSELGIEGKWIPLVEGDADRDAPGPRQWEHVYAAWRPVTSISCAELLGARLSEGSCVVQLDFEDRGGGTFLPNDIVGSWVEAALTSSDRPIERALEADAERLASLVRDHIIRQRSEADASHRRTSAEWANESKDKVGNDE